MVKATFVLPVKNGAQFIEKTLQSLSAQTLKEIEIIVVNDHSTDDTVKIVKKIAADDSRITVIDNPLGDTGEAVSRNNGSRIAKGEIILPTDADDPNNLERAAISIEELAKNKADIFYGTLEHYFVETGKREKRFFQPYDAKLLLNINFVNHAGASAYLKNAWEKVGGYDEAIEIGTDYDMWLNAQEKNLKFTGRNVVLSQYTFHQNQMTATTIEKRHIWLKKIRQKHSIFGLNLDYVLRHAESDVIKFFVKDPYYYKIWFDENSIPKKVKS